MSEPTTTTGQWIDSDDPAAIRLVALAESCGCPDPRAAASEWSKTHAGRPITRESLAEAATWFRAQGTPAVDSPEQQARDILDRMGYPDAQSLSTGTVVEIANLIAARIPPLAVPPASAYPGGTVIGNASVACLRCDADTWGINYVWHVTGVRYQCSHEDMDARISMEADTGDPMRVLRYGTGPDR